ncbi:hypothetical protein predicted by Glimmer/Critica [Sorangium cellulosum So ce56]|uniref:Uncharacterized protein n=1 Tax=Sorangium cellulosum (strain So ce56) TaxID=448385 RepID=A9GPR6_SORC5|nr:hypothetical protein [Sorangium cellulosum]CAN96796.1 hypothetical protein predicted by Glimmer/Critica [Sorangium cellulosum So ce56]
MEIDIEAWTNWNFKGGDRWNDWQPLSTEVIADVQQKAGAYVLGLPASKRPLGRLIQAEPHGLLDVGESRNLNQRLRNLYRCMSTEGERGHMAGWRLGSGGLLRQLNLTPSQFQVSWCYAPTKDEAYRVEGTILRAYYSLFGELPPLNYKFNWSTWEEGA